LEIDRVDDGRWEKYFFGEESSMADSKSVPNYLVQAILCTLFCCLPFGIVAIVFAAQVNGKLAAGDAAGAEAASKNAKMWCWVAFGCGLVAIVIWFAVVGIGVIATLSQHR
jgi:hypothetical protein